MKKNVATQFVGVQMITAADGTDFAGAVTCTVAKDGGALTASGGTGPTLQATGYYEYEPTQAETDADHIAFHFTGTGAISTSVQVYTHFPQTVDNNVLAAGATGFAAINTDVELILADTGTDGVVIAAAQTVATVTTLTNLPAITADWLTAAGTHADFTTEIQAGLATPTNITAGTITTVTDLTNERGKYAGGAVWIGPTVNTNTVSYVDGIITNPVSTLAAAKTIADALKLRVFHTVRTGASQIGATMAGYEFIGDSWSLTTTGGSQDVGTSVFHNAELAGGTFAGTTGRIVWDKCAFPVAVTVGVSTLDRCLFGNTLTLSEAGDYNFIDCASIVAGAGAPTFALGAGAFNISVRRWSGGMTFSGITVDDVMTISGELGTIDLGSPSGAADIQIRGTYKAITNIGSAAVNLTGAILAADVAAILVDTTEIGVAGVGLTNINLPNQTMDITGNLSGSVGSVTAEVTADMTKISGTAAAADNLEASAMGIVPFACEGVPTTTVIQTDLAEATDDHYIGRVVVFTTGAGAYEASAITDYEGATGTITITAVTTAPGAGDSGVVI